MVMSRVHLPGQIQLLVSPSLALEDVGDQGSLGVSVLSGCQCVQPRRHQSTEQNPGEPTAVYPRNWETICSPNIKPRLSISK